MLATDARRPARRVARPAARDDRPGARPRHRRGVTLGATSRRLLLHLLCLGLVGAAVTSPLAGIASVGGRGEVAEAVRHHARYLAAQAEAEAAGGWLEPRLLLTIADLTAANPPALAPPAAPASVTQPAPEAGAGAGPAPSAIATPPTRVAPPAVTVQPGVAAREVLQQRFGGLSDAYGVVVLDGQGTPLFEHRPAAQFQAASLYKLGVAAEVYRQERAGLIRFKDPLIITRESLEDGDTLFTARDIGRKLTIGEAVDFMMTQSSNVAALLLLRRIGPANVNDMFDELGMAETRLLERPFRNVKGNARNQTTPRDVARFFDLLLHGKIVDTQSSQAIIRLLLRQKIDDRLPASLPRGTSVAHKTGNLVGVVHDAGIIYSQAGPLVVVGLSQDAPAEAEATTTIAQLARVAFEAYVGAGG